MERKFFLNPFGSLVFPFIAFTVRLTMSVSVIFGWTKLTYNRKLRVWQNVVVALSGPMVNLTLALAFLALDTYVLHTNELIKQIPFFWFINPWFADVIRINLMIAFVNLLPFYPFAVSRVLAAWIPARYDRDWIRFKVIGLALTLLLFSLPMVWHGLDRVIDIFINSMIH